MIDAYLPKVPKNSPKEQEIAPAARCLQFLTHVAVSKKVQKCQRNLMVSLFKGKVKKPYDGRQYLIEFEDGDEKRMTHIEVKNHLLIISFTGGYATALESILIKNAAMNAIVLDDLRESQNVAFAVTHPVIGNQMEYKDLIKELEFREDWLLSKSNELGRLLQAVEKKKKNGM